MDFQKTRLDPPDWILRVVVGSSCQFLKWNHLGILFFCSLFASPDAVSTTYALGAVD